MSAGTNLLFAIVKSGNKYYLNRIREEQLNVNSPSPFSEMQILNVIRSHVAKYRSLPTPEILNSQGIAYDDTTQPVEFYLDELKKRSVFDAYKRFRAAFDPHVQGIIDMDKAIEQIESFSKAVNSLGIADKFKSMKELGRDIEGELDNRRNGKPPVFIPFGWPTLDRLTGGASGGDLCYFAARPGRGKSQLMTHMSHHAWTQGFSPLLITMEMTDVQIARRLYGIRGQFNHDALRRGPPSDIIDEKMADAIKDFDSGPEFNIVCGQVRQTVESVASLIDELQPDVVYIDAAYLLNMKNGSQSKAWEKIAQVGERLKEIAISRDIPIILTVQFNREAANTKKFDLEGIAGGDSIGQLASVVVAIKEPEDSYYKETRRTLDIKKNREGGVDEFNINFHFNPPNFEEVRETASQQDIVEDLY